MPSLFSVNVPDVYRKALQQDPDLVTFSWGEGVYIYTPFDSLESHTTITEGSNSETFFPSMIVGAEDLLARGLEVFHFQRVGTSEQMHAQHASDLPHLVFHSRVDDLDDESLVQQVLLSTRYASSGPGR